MTFKLKLLAAAALAALAACSKQEPLPVEQEDKEEMEQLVEVTLEAVNPEAEAATKTEMSGTTPYWSVGDAVGVSNGTSTNRQFTTDIAAASVYATFKGSTAVEGELYAYYPYTSNGVGTASGVTGAKFDLPSAQNPTAGSFDGAADMMLSKPFTVSPSGKNVSGLEFTRLGAIVRVVLKDRDGVMEGAQHPSSVSVTASTPLAGRLVIDMVNQTKGSIYYNAANTVTASYTAETQYAVDGSSGTYLIVYPQTLEAGSSLKIEAVTEDYIISKTITVPEGGIELLPGKVNTLNIGLNSGHITARSSSQEFKLFSGEIEEGDYVIASGGVAMKAALNSSRLDFSGYSLSEDAIFNPDESLVWHIAPSGEYWTVYNASVSRYAASTGAKNAAQLLDNGDDDKSLWTISGEGTYEFVNKQNTASGVNANLRYNSGLGFACYSTGTGGALTLYKLKAPAVVPPDPVLQEYTDVLTRETTGVDNGSTDYTPWTASGSASTAKYSGMSAGGNNAIQMRSNGNNSGIVSTVSGGSVKKVSVTWQSGTAANRVLNVYGSNTAYTAASDLFGAGTQGTLLGTIVYGTSTELEIEGDYAYVGVRSNSGALYLSEVEITWESTSGGQTTTVTTSASPTGVSSTAATLSGSYTGASSTPTAAGFAWGTASVKDNLESDGAEVYYNGILSGTDGSFTAQITSLEANTTYYYKAFVIINNSQYFYGSRQEFTTPAAPDNPGTMKGWLELPRATSGTDYYTGSFYDGSNRNYSYLYQYSTYTSLWTAYPLYSGTMGSGYSASWHKNENIAESKQVNIWSASYNVLYGETNFVNNAQGTGEEFYARGHQIPNADRSGNETMQYQTYAATNSTPQIQYAFNDGIWSKLEGDVRNIASQTDTVYVVTGAAFRKVNGSESITYIHPKGDSSKNVPVPNYYWKVLLKVKWTGSGNNKTVSSAKAIGVWIPHTPYTNSDYSSFVTSVNQIETWTGFDLFANLPDSIEETVEANTSWQTFQNF